MSASIQENRNRGELAPRRMTDVLLIVTLVATLSLHVLDIATGHTGAIPFDIGYAYGLMVFLSLLAFLNSRTIDRDQSVPIGRGTGAIVATLSGLTVWSVSNFLGGVSVLAGVWVAIVVFVTIRLMTGPGDGWINERTS